MKNLPDDTPPVITAQRTAEILDIQNEAKLYDLLNENHFAYQDDVGCAWKVITSRLDDWIDDQFE